MTIMMKKILTKRYWFFAILAAWWIDLQTLWAPSFYRALVISLNHLFVVLLLAGIVAWVFISHKAASRNSEISGEKQILKD